VTLRTLVACLVASLPLEATAHDLITAESAQTYLAAVAASQKTIASKEPAAKRALAHFELGKTLEEIRELLNRDLAAHGVVRGLPSTVLVAELQRQGVPLAWSEKHRRYRLNAQYFERSLALAPRGPHATDAGLRLLLGRFYDSFESDPLAADESWPQLAAQIALAQDLELQRRVSGRRQLREVRPEPVVEAVRAQVLHHRPDRRRVDRSIPAGGGLRRLDVVDQERKADGVVEVSVREEDVLDAGLRAEGQGARDRTGLEEHVAVDQEAGKTAPRHTATMATQDFEKHGPRLSVRCGLPYSERCRGRLPVKVRRAGPKVPFGVGDISHSAPRKVKFGECVDALCHRRIA